LANPCGHICPVQEQISPKEGMPLIVSIDLDMAYGYYLSQLPQATIALEARVGSGFLLLCYLQKIHLNGKTLVNPQTLTVKHTSQWTFFGGYPRSFIDFSAVSTCKPTQNS
jgi:hypothetical protein